MNGNKMLRVFSMILAICLLLSANTFVVFAEDAVTGDGATGTTFSVGNGFSESIEYANAMANGITAKYIDESRDGFTVKNKNMSLDYYLSIAKNNQVSSLKSASGKEYLAGTMDAYVKMNDGGVYYTSKSTNTARVNIYKHGFYYYDVHMLGQSFGGDLPTTNETAIDISKFTGTNGVGNKTTSNGELSYTATTTNPYVYVPHKTTMGYHSCTKYAATSYNAIRFTAKITDANATTGKIYILANGATGHSEAQSVSFDLVNDGEYHTYTVFINGVSNYTGDVCGIRFDLGKTVGATVSLKDVSIVNVEGSIPALRLDRTFHTYSDKLHQELHFVATEDVSGIAEVGMITELAQSKVDALVVKDANGTHSSLEGVDWSTAEYVGFHVTGVGVFGYILPVHENSGKLTVTLANGIYTITQASTPTGGAISAYPVDDPNTTNINEAKVTNTSNDYRMGQRIYTDENDTLDAFIAEAENERSPLSTITCDTSYTYDALRGAYKLSIGGTGFNTPFFAEWNKHYSATATFTGDSSDRNIYVYSGFYEGGSLEGAALLDENNMLLPIPMEVSKNFGGENEEPIYDAGDMVYSETVFPLSLGANESLTFTVLNLYQNWGRFPLKQLSSIQYFNPYYHLSVGTTETSCIAPWFGARDLWTLPDFRSQSMDYWFELEGDEYSNQPQHTHAGYQYFLQYTDAAGNKNGTENISNIINSSGPVYVDADMSYISDDGKIKVTYKHIEMPQTDELRAYYEIEYEILGAVTINDFANDFSFYSFEGYAGYYQKLGYLGEQGVVHKATNGTDTAETLVLGKNCPYVALYDLYSESASWSVNNANLGFVLYDSEIVIGGVERDDNFVMVGKNYVYSLSMDLGTVTLNPGDTINLNMVISPWGWTDSADDTNMQNIRANTCLDPLTVTVGEGSKIDSPFVPRVKSANGESVEFTLSGGTNNVAVHTYGFNKLTNPKIYEKIDGKWVEYDVSSYKTPDTHGYHHSYDGYMVYLDDDGTYSYSFAVDMTDVESRTFKVVASDDFAGWPEEGIADVDPINVYQTPGEIQLIATKKHGIRSTRYMENGGYVRLYSDGTSSEAYFNAYAGSSSSVTGQYVAVKYRLPSTNTKTVTSFDIYCSTVNSSAQASDYFAINNVAIGDGEWHLLVVDLSKFGKSSTFAANGNGEYAAKYLRFDVFGSVMSTEDYIDIAYVGMSDDLEDICKFNRDMESFTLATGTNTSTTDYIDNYVSMYGDVDGDNDIDTLDIIKLREYLVGINASDDLYGSDANDDGVVDSRDLILIRQYLANYDYETGHSSVVLGKQY